MKTIGSGGEAVFIPTEQPSQRTAFAKAFAKGPGRYIAFQSANPIHAMNRETGVWEEIDARFRPVREQDTISDVIPDPLYISAGSGISAVCGESGREAFLALVDGKEHTLVLGFEDSGKVRPVIPEDGPLSEEAKDDPALACFLTAQRNAQGTALYPEIYPGVDFRCHTDGKLSYTFTFGSRDYLGARQAAQTDDEDRCVGHVRVQRRRTEDKEDRDRHGRYGIHLARNEPRAHEGRHVAYDALLLRRAGQTSHCGLQRHVVRISV